MLAAQQNGVSKVEALAGVDESLKGEAGVGSNPTAFIQNDLMVSVAQLVEP